jgi:pyruvate/2-oxoglutarate dehydrogenase complex dihydrolipoamide acyltransferase (E2) component
VWFAEIGDPVYEGDRVVEIVAPGMTFDVPAPASGRLVAKFAYADDVVWPEQVLGKIDVAE